MSVVNNNDPIFNGGGGISNTYVYAIAMVSGNGAIQQNGTSVGGAFPTAFDPTQFQIVSNFNAASAFTLSLDPTGQQLWLTYTPTPEPSQLLLLGVMGLGACFRWLRRRGSKPRPDPMRHCRRQPGVYVD